MGKDEDSYKASFGIGNLKSDKTEKALDLALDIRKFEIGLYWQRAAYFWALIAAAFAAYFVILGAERLEDNKYLAYVVACIGLIFTWAWFLVNRGSKYWQENWENHVDMLEDGVVGPLYKTILERPANINAFEKFVIGPLAVPYLESICSWARLHYVHLARTDSACPPSDWRKCACKLETRCGRGSDLALCRGNAFCVAKSLGCSQTCGYQSENRDSSCQEMT